MLWLVGTDTTGESHENGKQGLRFIVRWAEILVCCCSRVSSCSPGRARSDHRFTGKTSPIDCRKELKIAST